MTYASTTNPQEAHALPLKITTGTFTNSNGGTGGTVQTQLNKVLFFACDVAITSYSASGGIVTIVTGSNVSGNWMAIGY